MTEKISQKIDLRETQEEKNILGSLNNEEKKSIVDTLNKFREQKKDKEKLGILILSQEELNELKTNISQPDYVNEFLDKQMRETVTTSEILEGTTIEKNLGGKENLEKFTQVSERILSNYLFEGNDSLFGHLPLNPDAKQNLTVGFNFFIFDFLSKNKENFNIEKNISFFTNNLSGLLEGDFSNFSNILSLGEKGGDIVNNLKSSFSALSGKLDSIKTELNTDLLTNGGENNEIFMNPNESILFFNGILDGSIKNIQSYVIGKESGAPIIIDESNFGNLKSIGNKWGELIPESVGKQLGTMSDIFNNIEDYKESIKLGLTKTPQLLEVFAGLEDFPIIGSVLKFFAGLLGINSFKDMFENSQFGEIQKELSDIFENEKLFIHGLKLPDDFLKIGNKNDLDFLRNLKTLGNGESDYKKILEGLLKKGSSFEKFHLYLQEKKLISNISHDGNLSYSSLSKSIELYTQYEAKKSENHKITLDEFIIEIQKEEAQKVAALNKFESIKQEEGFEKTDTELKSTCEVNGQWYNILWNKHGEIQVQSENKKYFYFVDSIVGYKKIKDTIIPLGKDYENNDFFKEHGKKVDIQAVKGIIPLLIAKGNINSQLEHSIETEEGKLDFKIKTTNVIDKSTENLGTGITVDSGISKKSSEKISSQGESVVGGFYNYESMKIADNFTRKNTITLLDDFGKSVSYQLNYKFGIDAIGELITDEIKFIIHKKGNDHILYNQSYGIEIPLKELYNDLKKGRDSVEIKNSNFGPLPINLLEFEKTNS